MIVNRIHKIQPLSVVHNIEVADNNNFFADDVLVSNCHSAKSVSITSLGKNCLKAMYRLGLTATLPSDPSDVMNIKSVLGETIFDLKSKELIDSGVLSQIRIANLIINYPRDVKAIFKPKKTEDQYGRPKYIKVKYASEEKFLAEYPNRNYIFKYIFNHIPDTENTLILVRKVEHLKAIRDFLTEHLSNKYTIHIVHGQVETEKREEIRTDLEGQENAIIIATFQTFKQGINIKRLHNIILGSSMKSEITIPQAIGRGLRLHKSKSKMILWDIVDDLRWSISGHNYVFKHFIERLKLYNINGFKYFTKSLDLEDLVRGSDIGKTEN